MMDFSLMTRKTYTADQVHRLPDWDVFLSAYNGSERVEKVFASVTATRKEWLIHAEYNLAQDSLPEEGRRWVSDSQDEAEFWRKFFTERPVVEQASWPRVCVDITGFMRPHIMVLPRVLQRMGCKRLDVLYSNPIAYTDDEDTTFSHGPIKRIRQVRGFEGIHSSDVGVPEILIIGSGYEDELIWRVAESRRAARKIQLFGLPSLQPHMYEQSRLRAARAAEAVGPLSKGSVIFAPAGDPFMTAQVIHDHLAAKDLDGRANIYLCPLSTKAQALGFALYYLYECVGQSVSIVFPYVDDYSVATSVGLSRVSLFRLELDWLL